MGKGVLSRTAVLAALGSAVGTAGAVSASTTLFSRVRSSRPSLRAVLDDGYVRSPTFRRLIDILEASAVVVYVEPGQCRRRDPIRLAGCLVYLAVVDDVRHLRVIVDQGFARDRLIALVGHELQHAVEIARLPLRDSHGEEAGIESDATAVRDSVYETDEAVRAGRTILEELRRKANRGAPSAAGIPGRRLRPVAGTGLHGRNLHLLGSAPVRRRPAPAWY
jgi:hypothetical protein